ncbi:SUKH-3 domain-containing protein [Deinococcus altitudinis]|uniref:SUKH-3 domain-containing protein n=1 Tax=Deinococcus altitudinis TaxID=468914 RepID=UPI003891E276
MGHQNLTQEVQAILSGAGWSPDRDLSHDHDFLTLIRKCVDVGFVSNNEVVEIFKQFFGLNLYLDVYRLSFEDWACGFDTYDEITAWMSDNVQLFPVADYNGDPILIGHDGKLYLTNFDVILRGNGDFYTSLSNLVLGLFFECSNSESMIL